MKTINKLKLNQLEKRELNKKEQLEVIGGCHEEWCAQWCLEFEEPQGELYAGCYADYY